MRGMDRTRVYNSICILGTLGVYERVYLFVCMNRILLWINCPTCIPHFINLCIPSMWKSKVTDNRSQQYTYFTLFCNNFTSTKDDLKLIGILFGQLEYSTNLSIYRKFTLRSETICTRVASVKQRKYTWESGLNVIYRMLHIREKKNDSQMNACILHRTHLLFPFIVAKDILYFSCVS